MGILGDSGKEAEMRGGEGGKRERGGGGWRRRRTCTCMYIERKFC